MRLYDAEELANTLLAEHRTLGGWKFKFDQAKVRFGYCNYRTRTISLSRHLTELNDEVEVRDTILHEIAHALAYQEGHRGHGKVWKEIALSIGCNGKRCYDNEVRTAPAKWKGTCPGCGRVIHRHRRRAISCGRCASTYNPYYEFNWELTRQE